MTYRTVRHSHPSDFVARAESWLLEREDENNLFLSIAYHWAAEAQPGPDALFATVESDEGVVGCAIRTPPHRLLATGMPAAAAPELARAVAEAYPDTSGFMAPAPTDEALAAAWAQLRGGSWRTSMRQRLYRLDECSAPDGVPGRLRQAAAADAALLTEWAEGFARDTGEEFRAPQGAIARWTGRGEIFVWEDGAPVCMAVAHGRTPNGVRVGYVYTPPELRGRGYASAAVAAVSRRMLDEGVAFCVLYADVANPTANRIYQRIGYRPLSELAVVDVELAEAPS